ncbi:MAG: V-type ATP synthase subunit F, partial [Thermoplasmata archaeon]|nr:V-type ATP synthase subunit F [Thermoplasmata archaeon]
MKTAVIGDRETVTGFRLAGVSLGFVAEDVVAAEKALHRVMEGEDVAVVVVTRRVYNLLEEDIARWRERNPVFPIIVEIDDASATGVREKGGR